MSRRSKGRLPPFISVIRSTRRHPAMIALSHGAFRLYVALRAHYNTELENAVYLSSRAAMKEIGANKASVLRWYRELEYYGFIRMISPAHHGLNGNGKAAHYRLTESKYLGQHATRDFEHWDGTRFQEQKKPSHYAPKKQKPRCDSVPTLGTVVGPYRPDADAAQVGTVVGTYGSEGAGYTTGSITSLTTACAEYGTPKVRPAADAPYRPPGTDGYGPAPSAVQERDLRGMPKDSPWLVNLPAPSIQVLLSDDVTIPTFLQRPTVGSRA